MVSATKVREHLRIKGGIYLAVFFIVSGLVMLAANVDFAFAEISKPKYTDLQDGFGGQTEEITVKRTIVFSDGAGGQVADTVVQEATFTRTGYPKFDNEDEIDWPAWPTADFAAVPVPAVSNYRANQTQVEAVSGVNPDNAASLLKDVTVTYTKLVSSNPTVTSPTVTSPTTTAPTVTSPTVTSPTGSSTTTATATSPTVVTASSSSAVSSSTSSSSAVTATPVPTTVTTVSTNSSSSSTTPLPSPTTTPSVASGTTVYPASSSATQNEENPDIASVAPYAGMAALAAGLAGALAYIVSTRRRNEAPVDVPVGEPQPSPEADTGSLPESSNSNTPTSQA